MKVKVINSFSNTVYGNCNVGDVITVSDDFALELARLNLIEMIQEKKPAAKKTVKKAVK